MNIKVNVLKNLKFNQLSARFYGSETASLTKVYEENFIKTVVLSSPKTRFVSNADVLGF